MQIQPNFAQTQAIAQQGGFGQIPLLFEIYADDLTPVRALRILQTAGKQCFLLESMEDAAGLGRFSFLGYAPKFEFACKNGAIFVDGKPAGTTNHPKTAIRAILRAHKSPVLPGFPSFTGGLVGYFAYDYMRYAEPTLRSNPETDETAFMDVDLMLFDKVVAFDHFRQKILLIANIPADGTEESYAQGKASLSEMADLLQNGEPAARRPLQLDEPLIPMHDKQSFCAMVETAKTHIAKGEVSQVVLSNRLDAAYTGSLLDVYRVLRTVNPSPYMFYLSSESIEAAGASPETLVKLENGILQTFPLAGTSPRGKTPEEDARLAEALLADKKETAEHAMLVDLGLADLAKVSEEGTVQVDRYMQIHRFSHVMHIGSAVSGALACGKDALDAIDAVLPAGTLSGAPKGKACDIIADLEGDNRGLYGGAVGYLDFAGNMDVCIAIRLAYGRNGRLYIRTGAGIVADSVPEKEHDECLHKARAVLGAVDTAVKDFETGKERNHGNP